MLANRFSLTLAGALTAVAGTACAGPSWGSPDVPGRLVSVTVEVEGRGAPLYPDPRGTGRFYLEAREGARYAIRLGNRTAERVGVAVTVDGLNVVSGERTDGRGRMYILDPWGTTEIRGWRSSLNDVRRFVFVDEQASYAARAGKANGKMGWIEVQVFREASRPSVCCDRYRREVPDPSEGNREEGRERPRAAPAPPPPVDQDSRDGASEGKTAEAPSAGASAAPDARPAPRAEGSRQFPGTGWGSKTWDPVVVVAFQPEPSPAEELTLRYEYAPALRALGIRVWPDAASDRLRDRERGEWGFAQPPAR